jgi:hypothetical protein
MIKGSKHNKATKQKIREAKLKNPTRYWLGKKRMDMINNQWNVGRVAWNKGGKCDYKEKVRISVKKLWQNEDYREKMVKAHDIRIKGKGKLHYNWLGGKSFEPYTVEFNRKLKNEIRERDCYKCKGCGVMEFEQRHSIHHIDYNKENCSLENLITICRSCNSKANFDRYRWIKFYKNIIAAATTK